MVVVDQGDSLYIQRTLPEGAQDAARAQSLVKAGLILDAMVAGGLDAMALGPADWMLGTDTVLDLVHARPGLPVLAANLVCEGEHPFPGSRIVERDGWRIGIAGFAVGAVEGCEVTDLAAAAAQTLAELEGVDLKVALVPSRVESELTAFADVEPKFDLILDTRGQQSGLEMRRVGQVWALGAGSRGKQVGLLRLQRRAGATGWAPGDHEKSLRERIDTTKERAKAMRARREEAPDDPGVKRLDNTIATFDRQIEKLEKELEAWRGEAAGRNLMSLTEVPLDDTVTDDPATALLVNKAKVQIEASAPEGTSAIRNLTNQHFIKDNSAFSGARACSTCHVQEYRQWMGTGHAKAWESLEADKRSMDVECYGCHATGVGHEAGPTAPAAVASFRDVQCESCHGPSKTHVDDPAKVKPLRDPPRETCTTCHDGDRDGGRFDWETYRPRIVHGPS